MTSPPGQVGPRVLGERLRKAREAVGITQAVAAEHLALARTTIVAIEKGDREARLDELQAFALLYHSSVNALLRQEAVHLDLTPQFRRLATCKGEGAVEAASRLSRLVAAEMELEDALGVRRRSNLPPERPILGRTLEEVSEQAEQDAAELRNWLGIGPGSVGDIFGLLELQLGVRMYFSKLDGSISGLFAYGEQFGACIMLNANHPRERLVQSAVHELGHLISNRQMPEVLDVSRVDRSREERYAAAFARGFLTPARLVRRYFEELTAGQSHLARRHIILLAHSFDVSREAVVRRLEELGLARRGTWDWFESHGGITTAHVREVLGETSPERRHPATAAPLMGIRLALLARESWARGLYSEGQLARMLDINRYELRELFGDREVPEEKADGLLRIG